MASSQTPVIQPRFVVAMIVRDAEDSIAQSLDSIQAIADRIVVLDSGSTDHTIQVVKRYTPHVAQFAWNDDFSEARNECLRYAGGQWILWMDAGEWLDSESAQALRQFVDERADWNKAYMLLVKVARAAGAVAAEQIGRVRLIPNRPGIFFRGRIQEGVIESLHAQTVEVEGLPWRIHRGTGEHDPNRKQAKARRDQRIAELAIREKGPQPEWNNRLGQALQTLGEVNRAAECFGQAKKDAAGGSPEMLQAYYGLLRTMDGHHQDAEAQLSVCLEALEEFPLDAQLLCAMGGYLQSQDRLDLASRAYQAAFHFGRVNTEVWHLDEIREISAVCMCLSLQLQKRHDEARAALEEALASHEQSLRLRRMLIDLHIHNGRGDEAIRHVDRLPADSSEREALRSAVRGACLAVRKDWISALAHLKRAYSAGCLDPICLRWLTVTLLSTGDHVLAKTVLLQWGRLEPENAEVEKYLATIISPESVATTDEPTRIDLPSVDQFDEDPKKLTPVETISPPATGSEKPDVRRNRAEDVPGPEISQPQAADSIQLTD